MASTKTPAKSAPAKRPTKTAEVTAAKAKLLTRPNGAQESLSADPGAPIPSTLMPRSNDRGRGDRGRVRRAEVDAERFRREAGKNPRKENRRRPGRAAQALH